MHVADTESSQNYVAVSMNSGFRLQRHARQQMLTAASLLPLQEFPPFTSQRVPSVTGASDFMWVHSGP